MKQVAILGAGLVSKPLADYLMDRAGYRVLMATRTVAKAEAIIAGRSNGRALAWTTDDLETLEGIVILVSPLQPKNAKLPILTTPFGMEMLSSALHP